MRRQPLTTSFPRFEWEDEFAQELTRWGQRLGIEAGMPDLELHGGGGAMIRRWDLCKGASQCAEARSARQRQRTFDFIGERRRRKDLTAQSGPYDERMEMASTAVIERGKHTEATTRPWTQRCAIDERNLEDGDDEEECDRQCAIDPA
jgi:hypothetical protein